MKILRISVVGFMCINSLFVQAEVFCIGVGVQEFDISSFQSQDTVRNEQSASLKYLLAQVYHAEIFRSIEIEKPLFGDYCDFIERKIFAGEHDGYFIKNHTELGIFDSSLYNTSVEFFTGSNELQLLDVSHEQRFSKSILGSIVYQKQDYSGEFDRQLFDRSILKLGIEYRSKSEKLLSKFGATWTNQSKEENGGVTKAAIDTLIEQDPSVVGISLLEAESKSKRVLYSLRNQLFLNGDSAETDSTAHQGISLLHQFQLELEQRKYSDDNPLSGFYNDVIYDSVQTRDLIKTQIIRSLFAINYGKPSGYEVQFGILNSVNRIKQVSLDSSFTNTALNMGLSRENKQVATNLQIQFYIDGNNSGDYLIAGHTEVKLSNTKNRLRLSYSKRAYEAPFFMTYYQSNHFAWYKKFEKTQELRGDLIYINTSFGLKSSIGYARLSDYVYSDRMATPEQFVSGFEYLKGCVSKTLEVWKISTKTKAQFHILSNNAPISLPKYNIEHSLYKTDTIFKKALKTKFGVQFEWTSDYFGDAYMPATGLYYYQRSADTGNNLLTHIFLELGVGTATISITALNVLNETLGAYRTETPDYPLPGRMLVFGVNWKFRD